LPRKVGRCCAKASLHLEAYAEALVIICLFYGAIKPCWRIATRIWSRTAFAWVSTVAPPEAEAMGLAWLPTTYWPQIMTA